MDRQCAPALPFDEVAEFGLHLLRRQLDPIPMPGQHPFEAVIEKFLDGLHQHALSPDQPLRGTKHLLRGVPPEMVAGEEEHVLVEKSHAACRVARHRNDLKLRHDLNTVSPLYNPFRIRNRFDVRPMNQPFCSEVFGVLVGIGDIVFVCEKDVCETALLLEGLDQMLEVPGRIDQPVAVRVFDEEAIRTERLL